MVATLERNGRRAETTPPQSARVLLTTDEPLLGRALKCLLEAHGLRAFDAERLDRARRMLGVADNEVILWVGDRLDAEAAEQAREIREAHRGVGLCVLADSADPAALCALVANNAEGFAFLLRSKRPGIDELLDALGRAADGRSTVEPCILEQLTAPQDPHDNDLEPLSDGEREVLELVALGLRNHEIARRLWKSEKTIEKRIGHLFPKLGLHPGAHPHLDRRVAAARIYLCKGPVGENGHRVGRASGSAEAPAGM